VAKRAAPAAGGPSRRRLLSIAILLAILVVAGVTFYRDRHDLASAWRSIGVAGFAVSLLFGLLSVATNARSWGSVLAGLGVAIPPLELTRVFCVSQIGKYLPGSVWPVLAQMSAGKRHGASKRTMLTANLLTILVSLCVGLSVACALLPTADHSLFHRYWWVLLGVPLLLAMLHPRAFTAVLDKLLALARRPALNERLPVSATIRSGGWSIASWLMLGLHLYFLCAALGHHGIFGHFGFRTFVLCVGSMAAAVCIGVLVIPVPGGAVVREAVLLVTLRAVLKHDDILAVVVASRAVMIIADFLAAAAAGALRSGRHPTGSQDGGAHNSAAMVDLT
jgi:uncharacterized membrane protein YbhN (UPF0104 family)